MSPCSIIGICPEFFHRYSLKYGVLLFAWVHVNEEGSLPLTTRAHNDAVKNNAGEMWKRRESKRPSYMDRMIEKALKLLRTGRVERLDQRRFNVIGNHGTYSVVRNNEGKVSCNCPGFQSRGRCSHSSAVFILTKPSIRKKYRIPVKSTDRV
jgi:hypothetical protein